MRFLPFWLVFFHSACQSLTGAGGFPEAAGEALESRSVVSFTARFARLLSGLDKESIGPAREAMLSGFEDGSLSREHSFLALEMIDQHWANLDAESFLTSCSKGMRKGSLDAQSKAIHGIFRRDRKRGQESWSVSAIRREPDRGPLLLLELAS
jgi:hypothetical protein